MDLMWFFLGACLILSLWALVTWNKKRRRRISISGWIWIIMTLITFLFTIAWSFSSLYEGETKAAGMGLLVFGGLTLILFTIASRLIKRSDRK